MLKQSACTDGSVSLHCSETHAFLFVVLPQESFLEISEPSMCTMCEHADSLLKTKVQITEDHFELELSRIFFCLALKVYSFFK